MWKPTQRIDFQEIKHSAKGTHWTKEDHKYIRKEGDRYIYKESTNKGPINYGKLGEAPVQYGNKPVPNLGSKKFQADLDEQLEASNNPVIKAYKGVRDFLNTPVSELAKEAVEFGDMTVNAATKKKRKKRKTAADRKRMK